MSGGVVKEGTGLTWCGPHTYGVEWRSPYNTTYLVRRTSGPAYHLGRHFPKTNPRWQIWWVEHRALQLGKSQKSFTSSLTGKTESFQVFAFATATRIKNSCRFVSILYFDTNTTTMCCRLYVISSNDLWQRCASVGFKATSIASLITPSCSSSTFSLFYREGVWCDLRDGGSRVANFRSTNEYTWTAHYQLILETNIQRVGGETMAWLQPSRVLCILATPAYDHSLLRKYIGIMTYVRGWCSYDFNQARASGACVHAFVCSSDDYHFRHRWLRRLDQAMYQVDRL